GTPVRPSPHTALGGVLGGMKVGDLSGPADARQRHLAFGKIARVAGIGADLVQPHGLDDNVLVGAGRGPVERDVGYPIDALVALGAGLHIKRFSAASLGPIARPQGIFRATRTVSLPRPTRH